MYPLKHLNMYSAKFCIFDNVRHTDNIPTLLQFSWYILHGDLKIRFKYNLALTEINNKCMPTNAVVYWTTYIIIHYCAQILFDDRVVKVLEGRRKLVIIRAHHRTVYQSKCKLLLCESNHTWLSTESSGSGPIL